ncbi:MAG: phosphoheptose isomerase [Bacteroidetes bacterium]|nr:phosphoheptose isomerase [Bacteroidota bacterium]
MINKESVFSEVKQYLNNQQLSVSTVDMNRPWGGFYVIEESDSGRFIDHFFPELDKTSLLKGKLSPKMLLVAPHNKLSWQYHHRRSEVWKLVKGEAAVVTSDTDVESKTTNLKLGDIITLKKGERHRLVGLNDWGIVAEIWIHTDPGHPSDEDDIVRLQDDFGR